jgi:hypothetical protein
MLWRFEGHGAGLLTSFFRRIMPCATRDRSLAICEGCGEDVFL